MDEFVRSWRRATSGEVAWVDAAGVPSALSAVPLLDGPVPCVALTYDRADLRPSLAAAAAVAFAVTDSRALPAGTQGIAAIGSVTVRDELDDGIDEDLLAQELRKYPPARTLVDSPLLRRENWWYLPRIVVRLDRVERTHPLPARRDAGRDALLVRDDGAGLRLDVAAAADWSAPAVALRGTEPLRGDGGPALAHGHDHSPDRERWEQWQVRGALRGDGLLVTARHGRPGLAPGPLRLLERLRGARALERGCRRGIAAAERGR
jgi:hypothetical protein